MSQSVSGQLSGFTCQSRTKPVNIWWKLLTFRTINSSLPQWKHQLLCRVIEGNHSKMPNRRVLVHLKVLWLKYFVPGMFFLFVCLLLNESQKILLFHPWKSSQIYDWSVLVNKITSSSLTIVSICDMGASSLNTSHVCELHTEPPLVPKLVVMLQNHAHI